MGEVSPKVFALDHRLEWLELEGYLSSVRQDPPRSALCARHSPPGRSIEAHRPQAGSRSAVPSMPPGATRTDDGVRLGAGAN